MVSDSGPGCEESRTTYHLEVERERDGVRLWTRMRREQGDVPPGVERERDGVRFWTRMRREQDNVPPGGGEGA